MGKTVPMSVRLAMITAAQMPGVTVSALCAELGISRKTFYELRKRFDKEGPVGLEPRSRRPLSSPNQIPAALEQRICRLREELPLDTGALAIFYRLERDGVQPLPSPRTIHRVLVRNELVTPQPNKRPRSSWRWFEYDQPNGCWQIDATEWHLRSGRTVWIMDILDDHSRYYTAADAVAAATATAAWNAFCHAAAECGLPAKVLSDNGLCFNGGNADHPGMFECNLAALGIRKANSRPYHPQTCGKLERAHQTLKKWLRRHPTAHGLTDLQHQLDQFRTYYNQHRPHRALNGATPTERFRATPPAQPADTPIDLDRPTTMIIADRHVNASGCINAGRATINLGTRWAGHTLTVITYGLRVAILDKTDLVRALTIDPTRRYQPLLLPKS
jgi:transposase InsO family protein